MTEKREHACCAPSAPAAASGDTSSSFSAPARLSAIRADGDPGPAVTVPGGTFAMGSDDAWSYPEDGEGPVRTRSVPSFSLERCAVTNARYAAFVEATGHVTQAEHFGWSFVFAGQLPDDFPPTRGVAAAPWWRQVEGASWCHPEGPQSDVDSRLDHPVVHVSWYDAVAYCRWVGRRLPDEAEWEYAARGGLEGKVFPWGDEREPSGEHRMNVWQGRFPGHNTCADGWYETAPVDAYEPNGYGLYNTCGNVWEWTDTSFGSARPGDRVTRGGSYLCHASYCRRYRVAARQGLTPDSTTGNVGFRCAGEPTGAGASQP